MNPAEPAFRPTWLRFRAIRGVVPREWPWFQGLRRPPPPVPVQDGSWFPPATRWSSAFAPAARPPAESARWLRQPDVRDSQHVAREPLVRAPQSIVVPEERRAEIAGQPDRAANCRL